MKNVFKVLGIIALVAVIGFSMVSCGDDSGGGSGGTLKITNENSDPIKKVTVYTSYEDFEEYNVNITTGQTWEQLISFSETTASLSVTVSFGSTTQTKSFTLSKGGTKELKLSSTGQLDTL